MRVEEIRVNPDFSEFDTGIAILKLTEPLVFSKNIQAVALTQQTAAVGTVVDISGWGRLTDNSEDMHRTLQVNDATVVETAQCERYLGRSDSQVICLESARRNGICRGDFGGPAVHNGELVGIAAYLMGECGSLLPDVFVNVAYHYDWIVNQMKQ